MTVRIFAFVLALAATGAGVVIPAPAHAYSLRGIAPADEYFGQLRMSILGIRNRIRELETQAAAPGVEPRRISSQTALVEDAMRDWQHKYPADPWIPRFRAQLAGIHLLLARR